MVSSRPSFVQLSLLVILLGFSSGLSRPVDAQDRSVPRFGPLVGPDTIVAGEFDRGRIWSVAQPPVDYFEKKYGVRADERGIRHARLATVRLPDCSGALVSSRGLVLTAARCVRPFLPVEGDSVQTTSFYAEAKAEEQALPGFYAERLVEVENVTGRVDSAQENSQQIVRARMQEEVPDNHRVEVVSEAGGRRFVAYTYRRFEDVRLAFVPDRAVSVYGRLGQPLTYPQHAWDVAVLRLYDEEAPLQTEQYFELRAQGARPGDAVFATAFPPTTKRNETHDQLAFRRDVQLPVRKAALDAWAAQLQQYIDTASNPGLWTERRVEVRAERRQTQAQLESLQNQYVMSRVRKRDEQLVSEEKNLIERLKTLQTDKRELADHYRAFWGLLHPDYGSSTLRRAVLAYRVQEEEISAADIDTALQAVPSQPVALDAAALTAHLDRLRTFPEADSTLRATLKGLGSPSSLVQSSVFSDPDQVRARMQEEALPETDPMFDLVSAFYDSYADFRSKWVALTEREKQLTDSLSRVRLQTTELPVALPQERSFRIADGRLQGYSYNGTLAPTFTTFYGLYGRHHATRRNGEVALPDQWQSPPGSFERSTPLVTVASTDLGGGAYGGPLLNTSLQLVGVVFDGNVQSAAGEYLFLPRRMRAVGVDVRGILEGLSDLYQTDRLVEEMTGEPASQ